MLARVAALGALLVLGATGCHRRTAGAASLQPCAPVDALLPAGAQPEQMAGGYDVLFVATGGGRAGSQVVGRLDLRPQDAALVPMESADSLTRTTQPAVGSLDVATDSIGAVRMGDLMASDPRQPGVGVYVTARRTGEITNIVARIGSGSNARPVPGMTAFDGGHFTLHVKRVTEAGFWGDWISDPGPGGVGNQEARGHFCAMKSRG